MAKRGKVDKKSTREEDVRPLRPRKYDKFILIVCEDENTEPDYFRKINKSFPDDTVYVREIGTGLKPKGIVERAIVERNVLALEIKKTVDEVWIVFDRDDEGNNDTTLESFNQAWELAEKENICIAFSNEVFELWLLMHLIDLSPEQAIPRADVYAALENQIKATKEFNDFIYKHGKSDVIDIIFKIGDESKAIKRAENLLNYQKGKKPIEANPSTYVHLLVTHLRELIAWYSYVL